MSQRSFEFVFFKTRSKNTKRVPLDLGFFFNFMDNNCKRIFKHSVNIRKNDKKTKLHAENQSTINQSTFSIDNI